MRLVVDAGGGELPAEAEVGRLDALLAVPENRLAHHEAADGGDRHHHGPQLRGGHYGMNFAHLYPPSDWPLGWVVVVAVLACMVAWGFIHLPHPGMAVKSIRADRIVRAR